MLDDRTANISNAVGFAFIAIALSLIILGGATLTSPLVVVAIGIGASAVIFASIILYILPYFGNKPKSQRISKYN